MTTVATILDCVEVADLLAALGRRGLRVEASPVSHPVVELPGLLVAPLEFRVVYRGAEYRLMGRAMEVLYALALARWQGRPRLRPDALAAMVWRGWSKEESLPSLRWNVHTVRRTIPGLVGSKPYYGYWLNISDEDEDVA